MPATARKTWWEVLAYSPSHRKYLPVRRVEASAPEIAKGLVRLQRLVPESVPLIAKAVPKP